jgi:hypothetical protein
LKINNRNTPSRTGNTTQDEEEIIMKDEIQDIYNEKFKNCAKTKD